MRGRPEAIEDALTRGVDADLTAERGQVLLLVDPEELGARWTRCAGTSTSGTASRRPAAPRLGRPELDVLDWATHLARLAMVMEPRNLVANVQMARCPPSPPGSGTRGWKSPKDVREPASGGRGAQRPASGRSASSGPCTSTSYDRARTWPISAERVPGASEERGEDPVRPGPGDEGRKGDWSGRPCGTTGRRRLIKTTRSRDAEEGIWRATDRGARVGSETT